MCYHPVKIINPKLKSDNPDVLFDKAHDKVFLEVPCGQCGECKQNRMNDYFVRTIAEFGATTDPSVGGYVFFTTLTYSEDNIPKFKDLLCFDSHHYRQFIKNLRNKIYNRYRDYRFLKFFFVSEYGGQTARSHHHCLFFVQNPVLDFVTLNELINSTWTHGFTQTNNPYGHNGQPNEYYNRPDLCLVDKQAAINYVSKYVNKDFDFLTVINKQKSCPQFKAWLQDQRYIEYLKNSLSYLSESECEIAIEKLLNYPDDHVKYNVDTRLQFDISHPIKDISYPMLYKYMSREDYNRFLPYNRLSHNFGVNLTNLDMDQLMKGYLYVEDTASPDGMKKYKLPMYVDRKVFYDYDSDTRCYTLNELGEKMKKVRLEHNHCYIQSKLPEFFNTWTHLCKSQEQIDLIITRIKMQIDSSVDTVEDVDVLVESLLDGRTWSEYINYITIYKSLLTPADPRVVQPGSYSLLNYELLQVEPKDYLSKDVIPLSNKPLFNSFLARLKSCTCGSCISEFENFDKLNDLYSLIRSVISDEKQKQYIEHKKLMSYDKIFGIQYLGKF